MTEGKMFGRMLDQWARGRRRTPVRQSMPNGASRVLEADDGRPVGLVPPYVPPADRLALLETPEALRARAETRFSIADQDAARGDTVAAQRNRAAGEALLRQALGR